MTSPSFGFIFNQNDTDTLSPVTSDFSILGLVLPRMRGIVFSSYLIILTLLGQGMGPYVVGIVSDRNGGDLAQAIMTINLVAPVIAVLLAIAFIRYRRDEDSVFERARAGGEEI